MGESTVVWTGGEEERRRREGEGGGRRRGGRMMDEGEVGAFDRSRGKTVDFLREGVGVMEETLNASHACIEFDILSDVMGDVDSDHEG